MTHHGPTVLVEDEFGPLISIGTEEEPMSDHPMNPIEITQGRRVTVALPGSLWDGMRGEVLDVDHNGVVEVRFDRPDFLGNSTSIFLADDLAPAGAGERGRQPGGIGRWLSRLLR